MDAELMHYGILGMKWGIRRYQNADGTLTPAGRKRYGADSSPSTPSSQNGSTAPSSHKSASEMTDDELRNVLNRMDMERRYNEMIRSSESLNGSYTNAQLQAFIDRIQLEKRYAELTAPPPKPPTAVESFTKNVLKPAFNEVSKAFVVSSMKKLIGLDNNDNSNKNNDSGKNKDDGGNKNQEKKKDNVSQKLEQLNNSIVAIDKKQTELQKIISSSNSTKAEKQEAHFSKGFYDRMKKAVREEEARYARQFG